MNPRCCINLNRSLLNRLFNVLIFPIKQIIPQPLIARVPQLSTNEELRILEVLRKIPKNAKLLDVGCGTNKLVELHRERGGEGQGVDVFDWGSVDLVVKDTSKLPYERESVDIVSFVACLNHIPNRKEVVQEAKRILRPGGRIVLTNYGPFFSYLWHKWAYWDLDQHERGMQEGEIYGLTRADMEGIFDPSEFEINEITRFGWKINAVYVYTKR